MGEAITHKWASTEGEVTFRLRVLPGGADTLKVGSQTSAEAGRTSMLKAREDGPGGLTVDVAAAIVSTPAIRKVSAPGRSSRPSHQPALPALPQIPVAPVEPPKPPPSPQGTFTITPEAASVLPVNMARKFRCFPIHREPGWIWIATDYWDHPTLARTVGDTTGLSTVIVEANKECITMALAALYGPRNRRSLSLTIDAPDPTTEKVPEVHRPQAWAGFHAAPVVRERVGDILRMSREIAAEALVDEPEFEEARERTSVAAHLVEHLLNLALQVEASDIHVEPLEDRIRVRMRLDGILHSLIELPRGILSPLVTRLKVLAGMDLVERRLPQEGRMRHLNCQERRVDVRVSTMPVVHGEGVVLRLLDTDHLKPTLEELGMEGDDLARVRRCLRGPRGLVLSTGPTGSGKSTTLYTLVTELNDDSRKIVTIEDPVEYFLPGLQQIQVQSNIGLTFERVIRSTMRQDPDVILVGEIRDTETARAAVKAALTGHLVLSSLHTADAAGAVCRLIDLGVEPAMCAAALRLVIGQRLIRRLCANCRRPVRAEQVHRFLTLAHIDPTVAEMSYEPAGCLECRAIGYHGRRAIFEVLDGNSPRVRRVIQGGGSAEVLSAAAAEEGMTTLSDAAQQVVRRGETSVEEALRVVWLD